MIFYRPILYVTCLYMWHDNHLAITIRPRFKISLKLRLSCVYPASIFGLQSNVCKV